jgi:hypothetical protein
MQVSYFPPAPLLGRHRYVSLLYRQLEGYIPPKLDIIDEVARQRFDLKGYAEKGGLKLVGGNFFQEGVLA